MKNILIVDDSPSIREAVRFTLSEAGYSVVTSENGEDAATHLGENFDLIITDLHMPLVDGIEFIKKARGTAEHKYTPILLLTTESQSAKKQEAKEAGATGWLVKPFNQGNLLNVIKKVIR